MASVDGIPRTPEECRYTLGIHREYRLHHLKTDQIGKRPRHLCGIDLELRKKGAQEIPCDRIFSAEKSEPAYFPIFEIPFLFMIAEGHETLHDEIMNSLLRRLYT